MLLAIRAVRRQCIRYAFPFRFCPVCSMLFSSNCIIFVAAHAISLFKVDN